MPCCDSKYDTGQVSVYTLQQHEERSTVPARQPLTYARRISSSFMPGHLLDAPEEVHDSRENHQQNTASWSEPQHLW